MFINYYAAHAALRDRGICDRNRKVPFCGLALTPQGKSKLLARIRRASFGNFGDSQAIKGVPDLYEMREYFGPGYRIFYAVVDQHIILLLAGSSKQDQRKAIAQATTYLADYRERRAS